MGGNRLKSRPADVAIEKDLNQDTRQLVHRDPRNSLRLLARALPIRCNSVVSVKLRTFDFRVDLGTGVSSLKELFVSRASR